MLQRVRPRRRLAVGRHGGNLQTLCQHASKIYVKMFRTNCENFDFETTSDKPSTSVSVCSARAHNQYLSTLSLAQRSACADISSRERARREAFPRE